MQKYNKHIAQFLCLILVLLGVEKINFFSPQDCEARQSFCPIATMYAYKLGPSTTTDTETTPKRKNCKALNISCETFFLAQVSATYPEKKSDNFSTALYFYKPVIHSNPYITIIDPPPNMLST